MVERKILGGGRRRGINDSRLLTCDNGDVINMGKSRSWEETKVPGLQIYVQNVKVVLLNCVSKKIRKAK